MRFFLFVCTCLFAFNCYAVGLNDVVNWPTNVLENTLGSGTLSKEEIQCFKNYIDNKWRPTQGYSAYDFGMHCMKALLNCELSITEDDKYDKCGKLAFELIVEYDNYNPVVGHPCNPEGAVHMVKHQNNNSYTTEKLVCKNGKWQKTETNSKTTQNISMSELQTILHTSCPNHQAIQQLGGETNRYFDCDLDSQKCLIALEANSKEPTTMYFCCKLSEEHGVMLYGSQGAKGSIKELKQHLKLNERCPDQD